MSTALAIASVTAVLKDLLNNGLIDADLSATVGNVLVTALPPDRIEVEPPNAQSQLNLFLYQVTPNPAWRNAGLPSRSSNGDRISNPPLALDLHYLLTAYGASELHGEILLGYGMQLLHETPVLARDAVRTSLSAPSIVNGGALPPELQALFDSGLAEQVEQIKIVPEALSTEELSRLWAAFQAKYRPTAAYQVSVVLIEARTPTRTSLPVLQRLIYVNPFIRPFIDRLLSQESSGAPILANQPVLAGHILHIEGRALRGDITSVRIGSIEVDPLAADITPDRIRVPLPAELTAGLHGVQVIHRLLLGEPPLPHAGTESNAVPLLLRPRITSQAVENLVDTGDGFRSGDLVIEIEPGVTETQRVLLLLNEFNPPAGRPSRAYSFPSPPLGELPPRGVAVTLRFPFQGVRPASYLLRVQVDGAESLLGTDASGRFNSPQVTI
jgi:hypothetical protein